MAHRNMPAPGADCAMVPPPSFVGQMTLENDKGQGIATEQVLFDEGHLLTG